jgi:hypothetical protein
MSTLTELFDQHRHELQQRLREELAPEQVVQEVKSWMGSLLALASREKGRSLTERRLLGFLVDVVNSSVSTLVSCERTTTGESKRTARGSASASRGDWFLRTVRLLLAVALGGVLYQFESVFYLPLLVAFVLLDVREWFMKPSGVTPAVPLAEPVPGIQVNIHTLLSRLRETFRAIDAALMEVAQPLSAPASPLGDDAAFLELFQELLYAASVEDGTFALKQLKPLIFLLEKHGIRVERFTAERAFLFDAVPSLDDKGHGWRTLKPALVTKEGKPLRRGLVAEPTNKERGH